MGLSERKTRKEGGKKMSKHFVYPFDNTRAYEDVAPCKECGSWPYRTAFGIRCMRCGYEAATAEKWNADPEGHERASIACVVEVRAA